MLPTLDKSKHIFEDRFTKTNHPANTKKATFPGKHVVEDKDKLLVFEGNLEKIPAPENKNLNGEYSNTDIEMEISPNIFEDLSGCNKSSL